MKSKWNGLLLKIKELFEALFYTPDVRRCGEFEDGEGNCYAPWCNDCRRHVTRRS